MRCCGDPYSGRREWSSFVWSHESEHDPPRDEHCASDAERPVDCREAQAAHPETQRADYRVIVATAGGPGFVDSAVTATLRSASGEEHTLRLCPGGGPVPAAARAGGHQDLFLLNGIPIRNVHALTLALDPGADAAAWFLRWVRIVNCITGETRVFAAPSLFGPAAPGGGAQQTVELEACPEVLAPPHIPA